MDITQIDEQWIEIPRARNQKNAIVAISNTGKYRRADGTDGILELRRKIWYDGKKEHAYRIIAENFLITVKRPDQICIDHITHYPTDYNVNDVRNLRWCTNAENNGFEEARENTSKSMKGTRIVDNNPRWRGDSATPNGKYRRALKEYRRNPTEENLAALKEARLKWNELQRSRRAKG